MAFQISTRTLADAFVGVEYSDFVVCEGFSTQEGGTSSFEWTLGGTSVDQTTPEDRLSSNLTTGLTWSVNNQEVTIYGTPVWDFGDDTQVGAKFPTERVELEFVVTHTLEFDDGGDPIVETASRTVVMNLNRIIDDYTVNIFLDNYKEADNLIKEDLLISVLDGIPGSPDSAERAEIVNSLLKRIGDCLIVYAPSQGSSESYIPYLKILGDEFI